MFEALQWIKMWISCLGNADMLPDCLSKVSHTLETLRVRRRRCQRYQQSIKHAHARKFATLAKKAFWGKIFFGVRFPQDFNHFPSFASLFCQESVSPKVQQICFQLSSDTFKKHPIPLFWSRIGDMSIEFSLVLMMLGLVNTW